MPRPDGLLPHRVYREDARKILAGLVADDSGLSSLHLLVKPAAEALHELVLVLLVIPGELDDVDALEILARHLFYKVLDLVPDNVALREVKDLGVNGLDRECVSLHHERRVPQGRVKTVILDIDQSAECGDFGQIELCLDNEGKVPSLPQMILERSSVSVSGS